MGADRLAGGQGRSSSGRQPTGARSQRANTASDDLTATRTLGAGRHDDSRSGGKKSARKQRQPIVAPDRAVDRPSGRRAQRGRGTQGAMTAEDITGKAPLDRHARRHSFSGQPEYEHTSSSWSSHDQDMPGFPNSAMPAVGVELPQVVVSQPQRAHPSHAPPKWANAGSELENDDVTQDNSDPESESKEEEESMDCEDKHLMSSGQVVQTPLGTFPTSSHFHGQADGTAMSGPPCQHPADTCEGHGLGQHVGSHVPTSDPGSSSGGRLQGFLNTVSGMTSRVTKYMSGGSSTSKQPSHPEGCEGCEQQSYQGLPAGSSSRSNPGVGATSQATAHPNIPNGAAHHHHHGGSSYNSYDDGVYKETESDPGYAHGGLSLLKQKKLLKYRSDQATYQMIYDIYLRAVGVIECFEWREHGRALLQNGIQLSESSVQLYRETQNRTHDEVRPGLCTSKGAWVGETTVLAGAEERGVDGPSLDRSCYSRLQPISFLFFD